MKLLVGADVDPDPDTGAAGSIMCANQALRDMGHSVEEFWAPSMHHRIRHGNLHYILELPGEYAREVNRRCAARPFDVIELSQPHAYRVAREHGRYSPGGIFVNRSHGIEPMMDEVLAAWAAKLRIAPKPLFRRMLSAMVRARIEYHMHMITRYADGLAVGASDNAEYVLNRYHMDPARVCVIPLGIHQSCMDTPVVPMTSERLTRMLCVAQFHFFKGPHILAAAVERVLTKRPEARFSWVCSRAYHDEAMALFAPAVRDRVSFEDQMPNAQLLDLYEHCGIFVFATFFEGFGKVALEAMSRGMCTVSSSVGGMKDVIASGHDGVLIDPGNIEGFISAIDGLMSEPTRAKAMSLAARRKAVQYSWTYYARLATSFYESLLSMKGRARAPH